MYLQKNIDYSVKDVDTVKGIVSFYIGAFDNVDSDGDVITKGAYERTLKERGPQSPQPRVKHLRDHDTRLAPGKVMELYEDSHGLLMRSQLGKSTLGQDTLKDYQDGIITEHSQGFEVVKEYKRESYNEITEIKLWEGSTLTAWGANPLTPMVDIKSTDELLTYKSTLERRLRNGTYSDEYYKNLKTLYEILKHHFSEPQQHSDKPDSYNPWEDLFNQIKN